MKKTATVLAKISYVITGLIVLFLAIESARTTFVINVGDLTDSAVREGKDNILVNIIFAIIGILVFYCISRFLFTGSDKEKDTKRLFIVSACISALVFVALIFCVVKTFIPPYWDQMQVYLDAKNFNAGDYSDMEYVYLKMYPQQYGLIFFEGLLLRICSHYGFLQCLNALFVALSIFLSGRLTYEITEDACISFFAVLLTAADIPLMYYVSFVYGDVFMVFALITTSLLITRWIKTGKWGYLAGSYILMCISLPVRQNTLLYLIALMIFLTVMSIREKKLLYLIAAPFFLILPLLANAGTQFYYEKKSGIEISRDEIPHINWVVMGLQGEVDEGLGVGYYNGYNYASWNLNGSTKKNAIEFSKGVLAERIHEFKKDPGMTVRFFRYKALEQWNEPLFESAHMTVAPEGYEQEYADNPVYSLFYSSKVLSVIRYAMNRYMFFVYLFVFIYICRLIVKDEDPYSLLLTVAFTGGFLFSLIWEAKGRYVFPFFAVLLPVAAIGLKTVIDFCTARLKGIIADKGKAVK